MPLSARMPSARSLSCAMGVGASLGIAIEGLLERGFTEAAIGVDEALVGADAPGDIGVDQRLDGAGHVLCLKAGPDDLADRGMFGRVATQRDLVQLAALLLDAENADMANMVMAAGIDAAGNLDLEIADFGLTLGRGELLGDFLGDRDRAGIGQCAEI